MLMDYLFNVFFNQYFLLFLTAALGYLIGKIKIRSFTLGSTGGMFSGIFIGWLMVTIAKKVAETDSHFETAQKLIGSDSASGIVDSGFQNFFLIIFMAAIGLTVGPKIKKVFNATGIKLVIIGILIPVISMALTFGCLKIAPAIMGTNYSGYSISGMYSGCMTNTAAFGNSMAVLGNNADYYEQCYENSDINGKVDALAFLYGKTMTDEQGVRNSLENQYAEELNAISDEAARNAQLDKYVSEFMETASPEEITAKKDRAEMYAVIAVLAAKSVDESVVAAEHAQELNEISNPDERAAKLEEFVSAAKGKAIGAAKAQGEDYIPKTLNVKASPSDNTVILTSLTGKFKGTISGAYAVAFPVGTIIIILAMTIFAALFKKSSKKEIEELGAAQDKAGFKAVPHSEPKRLNLFYNALTFGLVIVLGYIIGMIKIPLGHGTNFTFSFVGGVLIASLIVANLPLGPAFKMDMPALGFIREFGLLFFMSIIGLTYGYQVVHSFLGSGLTVAVMSAVVEIIAVIIAIIVGRLLKLRWDILAGAICGGCTSTVGLGTALTTMDSDEPGVGYGISQPFAILANVLLISWFHFQFFL